MAFIRVQQSQSTYESPSFTFAEASTEQRRQELVTELQRRVRGHLLFRCQGLGFHRPKLIGRGLEDASVPLRLFCPGK